MYFCWHFVIGTVDELDFDFDLRKTNGELKFPSSNKQLICLCDMRSFLVPCAYIPVKFPF